MKKSSKFSPELRERAVRLVQEHRGEYQRAPTVWMCGSQRCHSEPRLLCASKKLFTEPPVVLRSRLDASPLSSERVLVD